MIPACQSCHSMKDRMRLMDWSSEWFATVYNDIQNNVSRETKIFLMKTIDIVQDALEKQNAKND